MDTAEALELFSEIQGLFPSLEMTLDQDPDQVDLAMEIPCQPGLRFHVHLNLQGDELHLVAGEGCWLEWFPGHDPAVKKAYLDVVTGLLAGRLRVVEHRRGEWILAAELQEPTGEDWQTIGRWSRSFFWLPSRTRTRTVLRNTQEET